MLGQVERCLFCFTLQLADCSLNFGFLVKVPKAAEYKSGKNFSVILLVAPVKRCKHIV